MPNAFALLTVGLLLSFCYSSPASPLLAQTPLRPDPTTLAGLLQKHYDQVRDFAADFVHVYEGGALRMTATEKGTVQITARCLFVLTAFVSVDFIGFAKAPGPGS